MGKSPGKWIKSLLFRKKASKTREVSKPSYEKASSALTEEPVSTLAVEPSFISAPAPLTFPVGDGKENSELGNDEIDPVSNDESTLSSFKQDGDAETKPNPDLPHDMERIRLEQAATKAQAIFRGYLARREFRTLKGIIRLQAVIRGHLVRRQAVVTLCSSVSDKSMKDLVGAASNLADEEKSILLSVGDDPVNDLGVHHVSNVQDKQFNDKNETNSKEDQITNEIHKIVKRRASLPAKHDDKELGQRDIKVPSYMAATKSAKAKVRGQVSPRFGQDMDEKNGQTRRHSLPSSGNGKLSSSPRVQKLVQTNGKGLIRIDRSLSSSRDSNNDKVIQAEWRR